MCYALVFLGMVQWMDAPRTYIRSFHNSRVACEAHLLKEVRTLKGTPKFSHFDNEMTVVLKTKGEWSYGQCSLTPINNRAICEKGILGDTGDCDCEKLNDE